MSLIEVELDLYCYECGEQLDVQAKNGRAEVIPCSYCQKDQYYAGFEDGKEACEE